MVVECNKVQQESKSIGFSGFGNVDSKVQRYECFAQDYSSLMNDVLPDKHNPFKKWASPKEQSPLTAPAATTTTTKNPSSTDVTTWFPNNDHPVFHGSDNTVTSKAPLSYNRLHKLIQEFIPYAIVTETNDASASPSVTVVGLLLPPCYMVEMAVAFITLLSQHSNGICVAPIDPNLPNSKLVATIQHLQCSALITTNELYDTKIKTNNAVCDQLCDIRTVQPSKKDPTTIGVMEWTYVKQEPTLPTSFDGKLKKNGSTTTTLPALLLCTSGTTSTPKIVPLTAYALLYNATCIAASLDLGPDDVGCNAMPLFHIGGISCAILSVLVSGSSVVMMEGPFDSQAFLDTISDDGRKDTQPTWYYGVPSMHKTLILAAKARLAHSNQNHYIPNRLKFIRSGAAHLPHETAVELAQVFRTTVMPTYSMSECMPVCSCNDAPVQTLPCGNEVERVNIPDNTVGNPIGSAMAIVDEQGEPLPFGVVGEVALKGPGVIDHYIGIPQQESHTPNGFFRTGDMGQLDQNGRLVLSGRQKEMIKRGGEQVWPNEVDNIVASIQGIQLAVTFGVPNELWGEEVHAAVVLDEAYRQRDRGELASTIAETCRTSLGEAATPVQVYFIDSADTLPKTASGKYRRNDMASQLGAQAMDTGALKALERMVVVGTVPFANRSSLAPSTALNGVRFLAACFVVQQHVGLMPNNAWIRVQNFSFNMSIFFMLGAFQLVCTVKTSVKNNAALFIGTKIGSMQALFITSQILAFATHLVFQCGKRGYSMEFHDVPCNASFPVVIPAFVVNTFTGILPLFLDPSNPPVWFQAAFYTFLMIFPFLDDHLRSKSRSYLLFVFYLTLGIASIPYLYYLNYIQPAVMLNFRFISWMPALVAAMIAGYFYGQPRSSSSLSPRAWGIITDLVSVVFLIMEIIVATSPDSIYMKKVNFEVARPGEPIPEDQYTTENGMFFGLSIENATYVRATDVTHDEFVEFVHSENDLTLGRWQTDFGRLIGFSRLGSPLVLLWLFGLAHGHGLTARLMDLPVMQFLSPHAYALYLFHVPIARLYWVATRGHVAEFWWLNAPGFPFPVHWYELLIIIAICILLAIVVDRYIVATIAPYTIKAYVWVFQKLCCCCCCCPCTEESLEDDAMADDRTMLRQMVHLVKGLTGNQNVTRASKLSDLGLDSLGATALLGTLRASIPAARTLSLGKLVQFETMGDLIDFLEHKERHEKLPSKEDV